MNNNQTISSVVVVVVNIVVHVLLLTLFLLSFVLVNTFSSDSFGGYIWVCVMVGGLHGHFHAEPNFTNPNTTTHPHIHNVNLKHHHMKIHCQQHNKTINTILILRSIHFNTLYAICYKVFTMKFYTLYYKVYYMVFYTIVEGWLLPC